LGAIGFRAQAQTSAVPSSFATVGAHPEFEGAIVIDTEKRLYLVLDGVLRPALPNVLELIRERTNVLDGVPTAVIAKWSTGPALPDDLQVGTLQNGNMVIYSKPWYRTVTSNVYNFVPHRSNVALFSGSTDLGDLPASPLPPSQIAAYQRTGFVAPPTPAPTASPTPDPSLSLLAFAQRVPGSMPGGPTISVVPVVSVPSPKPINFTDPASLNSAVGINWKSDCPGGATFWPVIKGSATAIIDAKPSISTSLLSLYPITAITIPIALSSSAASSDCEFASFENGVPYFFVTPSTISVTGVSPTSGQQQGIACTPSGGIKIKVVSGGGGTMQCTFKNKVYWVVSTQSEVLTNIAGSHLIGSSQSSDFLYSGASLTAAVNVSGGKSFSTTLPQNASYSIQVTQASTSP